MSSRKQYEVYRALSTLKGERKEPGDRVIGSELKVPIETALLQGVVRPIKKAPSKEV